MTLSKLVSVFLALIFINGSLFASEERFFSSLKQGTMTFGGSARMPITWDGFGNTEIKLNALPAFGYFVVDQLELAVGITVGGTLYQSEFVRSAREPLRWGAHVGLRYFFKMKQAFYPFLGVSVGADVAELRFRSANIWVEIPMGVLFFIQENWALQFGAPLRMTFVPPPIFGIGSFEWSPGYLGVQVFF